MTCFALNFIDWCKLLVQRNRKSDLLPVSTWWFHERTKLDTRGSVLKQNPDEIIFSVTSTISLTKRKAVIGRNLSEKWSQLWNYDCLWANRFSLRVRGRFMANLRKTVHASKVSTFRLKQILDRTWQELTSWCTNSVAWVFVLTEGHLAAKEQK